MSILLNSNITTPVSKSVIEAMEPFANKAIDLTSVSKENQKALKAYKEAIDKIYRSYNAVDDDTVILTSCVNEATSQVFYSVYLKYILTGRKNSIIISARAPINEIKLARFLESQGCRVYRIPVTADGTVDVEILKEYINSKTALVSIAMVDDESGVIQPIEEISVACSLHGVAFYCDASQAIGKIPIDLGRTKIDFCSFGSKTIEGPKDIASLYISKDAPIELMPLIFGGDFEQGGLRSNIEDVSKVIGYAKALEDAIDALDFEIEDIRELRDELEEKILEVDGVYSLAPWALRVPNISIFAVENVSASMLLDELATKDIVAYSFATHNHSHFERTSLIEINALPNSLKFSTIGFSLGSNITNKDIEVVAKEFKDAVKKIRSFSGDICKEDSWAKQQYYHQQEITLS